MCNGKGEARLGTVMHTILNLEQQNVLLDNMRDTVITHRFTVSYFKLE